MTTRKALFKKLTQGKAKERNPVTIYLSRPLFVEFRNVCKKNAVSASQAIEELIRQFLSDDEEPRGTAHSPRVSVILSAIESDPSVLDDVETLIETLTPTNNTKRRLASND